MQKQIVSENPIWRKSKMAANMAALSRFHHITDKTWLVIYPFLGFRGRGTQICQN